MCPPRLLQAPKRKRSLKQLFQRRGGSSGARGGITGGTGAPRPRSVSGTPGDVVAPPSPERAAAVRSTGSAGCTYGSGSTVKVLNNYIGIGIDAKVAVEFHQIRDSYPSFFQSQFGNKMWCACTLPGWRSACLREGGGLLEATVRLSRGHHAATRGRRRVCLQGRCTAHA